MYANKKRAALLQLFVVSLGLEPIPIAIGTDYVFHVGCYILGRSAASTIVVFCLRQSEIGTRRGVEVEDLQSKG